MTGLIDENGKLAMPAPFRAGEAVRVELAGSDTLVVHRLSPAAKLDIRLVKLEDGSTVITGLPVMNTADVQKLLEDFP